VYPREYFSHPRIASFCHRTNIWRNVSSINELSKLLIQLIDRKEKKRFESECLILNKNPLPEMVDIYSEDYPEQLREIYDPPLVLSYLGNIKLLKKKLLGVVGTRKASKISLLGTRLLIQKIKDFDPDIGIVSGMALGIDREAFTEAMKLDLSVVGLLGTSVTEEYPPGNRDLYLRMKASNNALFLSEYILPTTPARWTFPKRNRLISGLSSDIYIMESGKKSGTLSTAMSALSQNRDIHVFNHPLQLDNEGGKSLLRDGAEELKFEFISHNKGFLEKPEFYSSRKIYNDVEWKEARFKEILYQRSGNKTPLGQGVYWVATP